MTFSAWTKKLNPQRQAIRQRILNDPYYRFCSLEEIEIAAELGVKIEVNQATIDDWLRLPGISIHQARTLVNLVRIGVELLCIEDVAAALSISVQPLNPLVPLLSFCYYDPDSLLTPQRINPNTATIEQLESIFLIDIILAQKIVNNRQENGNYKNLVDFQKRLTLDGQIIAQLMHYLQF
ncbi:ComEA family DNA-binding protein [Aphanothece sacrum]|uniref:DNA uptake protein n=1 Tax=Aphanothece sacrum FPU1 TaxID=1920663 RepID=A0A401IDS7_APHSA|nr:ComEA family DNA-binding protein [Aphanothece sacrum]GBF79402.1 DNA uptake protein [Aphanothece sacrum FPU1]GBF86618.1 DNA uptake protein [Aphanothece sacrum FPU3]